MTWCESKLLGLMSLSISWSVRIWSLPLWRDLNLEDSFLKETFKRLTHFEFFYLKRKSLAGIIGWKSDQTYSNSNIYLIKFCWFEIIQNRILTIKPFDVKHKNKSKMVHSEEICVVHQRTPCASILSLLHLCMLHVYILN